MDRRSCVFARASGGIRRRLLLARVPRALLSSSHKLFLLGPQDRTQPSARCRRRLGSGRPRMDLSPSVGTRAPGGRGEPHRCSRGAGARGRVSHRSEGANERGPNALAPRGVGAVRYLDLQASPSRGFGCLASDKGRRVLDRVRASGSRVSGSRAATRCTNKRPRRGPARQKEIAQVRAIVSL
jgi:hypothetical protein